MPEIMSASVVNTLVYAAFAMASLAIYRFLMPHKALPWIAAALILADDSVIYQWLAERGSLFAELAAAVMAMCSALFSVKAAMLLAHSKRLVPVCAFLTLPLSMIDVLLFNAPNLYPYQLAIGQLALAMPYLEAMYVSWHGKRADRIGIVAAVIFACLSLVYFVRVGVACSAIGSPLTESEFLQSAIMRTTLQINGLLVAGVLIAIFVMLGRDYMTDRRAGAERGKTGVPRHEALVTRA